MRSTPIIVLDLETTGLSPYASNITEIAAVKVQHGNIIDEFHTLVNPQEPIPRFITRLTGITNEMVQDAPTIKEVLPSLKQFLGDYPIIAHNAGFDYNFLTHNFEKHTKQVLTNTTICTAKLARRLHSELPSKRLGALCEYYGITNEQAHRAMGDTRATAVLFYHLLAKLEQHYICQPEDVCKFERMQCSSAIRLLEKQKEKMLPQHIMVTKH